MDKWSKYDVLDSLIGKVGHQLTYQNGSAQDIMRFIDIRAGLAFATDSSPFYCIVLGQQWFDPKLFFDTSPSFIVLFEGIDRGLDLERRFSSLADIAALYKCDFYADLAPLCEPEADSWYDYRQHKNLQHGDLDPAPWADNFRMGIELCKTAVRTHKLTIPKDTEVFNQLSRITESDLADQAVRSKYYTLEALRHVVCSFKRDPASLPSVDYESRLGGVQEGWMF